LVEVHFRESSIPVLKQSYIYAKRKISKFYWLHVLTMLIALGPVFLGWLIKIPELSQLKEVAIKVIANLFLVQSWIPDSSIYFSLNGVSWYLSTSMVMYFAAPFLHSFLGKLHSVKQKNSIILSVFILQIVLAMLMEESAYLHAIIYIHPLTRVFDFLVGMLLGSIYKDSRGRFSFVQNGWLEAMSMISLAGIIFLFPRVPEAFSYVILSAPIAWLLVCVFSQEKGMFSQILSSAVLTFIGNISFEIFMVHRLVIGYWEYVQWISRKFLHQDISEIVSTISAFAISVLAAQILHILKARIKRKMKL
jgi:peptidoglycan/LPS O-acetylase OafA/YrhL